MGELTDMFVEVDVMNAREQLLALEDELRSRGVRDVKFCFGETAETPFSDVVSDVHEMLRAHIQGETDELPPINDSVRVGK